LLAISNPSVSEYPCLRFPGTRTNEVARQFWTCAREMPKREPHKCLRIRVLRRGRRVKGGTGTRNNLHGPYNIYLMPRTLFPFFACSSSPTNKLTLSGREGHSETSVSTVRVACVYAARCPGHRVLALIPGFCRQMIRGIHVALFDEALPVFAIHGRVGGRPGGQIDHGREQRRRSRDATDWFRGYGHSSSVS
jgi:hypothetical protein